MSAPNTAYRTKSVTTRNIANTADLVTLVAILQSDKATMKSRFYLDGITSITLSDGDGVIGYCLIGSANYRMHNTARIGNIRTYDGGDCVLFNDAGLNTLGFVGMPVITNSRVGQLAGSVPAKSAYYVTSDMVKWQFSINYGAWSTPADIRPLAQGVEESVAFNHTDLFQAGNLVRFRGVIVNAEGTFTGIETDVIEIRLRLVVLASNNAASAAFYNWVDGERENYYTDSLPLTFSVGSRIFVDDPVPISNAQYAPSVYYSDGVYWYQVNYVADRDRNEIVARGLVTSSSGYPNNWPSNDPAYDNLVSNTQQATWYEGTTYEGACTAGQNQENSIRVWLRTMQKGSQTYYRDQAGTIPLTGYFQIGGGVYQYVSGARSGNVYLCAN